MCVCVYVYFSDRMIAKWYILGEAKDFSSLYFTEAEPDLF